MSESKIYRSQLVQELLDQLPQPKQEKCSWSMYIPISKKFEDNGRHIIAGYASVEVIDSQNELIPLSTLKAAWKQFKANKDFYFGSLMHSNVPVIKVLDTYETESGEVLKSGVDQNGLFIVSEVRQDIEKGKQSWELIEAGKLTGYSIGGEALLSTTVCEGSKKCFERIDKMELHEIAVVDKPANAPSIFKIIKRDNSKEIKVEKSNITKEMSVEDLKKKLESLIKERERLSKVAYPHERTVEQKSAEVELSIISSQVSAIERALGEKMINKSIKFDVARLDIALKRMVNKPFAGYEDFKDCERENADKKNPGAYCATIQETTEKLDKAEEGYKCKFMECPVDGTINKALWKRLELALEGLVKNG